MSDLISRQAAIALAKDLYVPTTNGTVYQRRCIDPDAIRELPPAQPEIIRCKNCRHFNNGDCTELPKLVSEDDFCSFAERRLTDE